MNEDIAAIYDMLWDTSFEAVSSGNIDIDPHITHPETDFRRGLTLVIRPSAAIRSTIQAFLQECRRLEPDQYYYSDSNMHFTVLSLFTATSDYQVEYDRLATYKMVVEEALEGIQPFSLRLSGITVSRSALLVCGFPQVDFVNVIRENLRKNLQERGLAGGLDTRYKLVGNHTTVLRFSAPLRDPVKFGEFLLENKQRKFGQLAVTRLELVKNDWYMSEQHSPVMAVYPLGNA